MGYHDYFKLGEDAVKKAPISRECQLGIKYLEFRLLVTQPWKRPTKITILFLQFPIFSREGFSAQKLLDMVAIINSYRTLLQWQSYQMFHIHCNTKNKRWLDISLSGFISWFRIPWVVSLFLHKLGKAQKILYIARAARVLYGWQNFHCYVMSHARYAHQHSRLWSTLHKQFSGFFSTNEPYVPRFRHFLLPQIIRILRRSLTELQKLISYF